MDHPVYMRGISKSFGTKRAVNHLDMSVAKGEVYGFLGPNGAGKTTSIRMMMGLIDPDKGDLSVLGKSRARDASARIGYLPEERGLYQNMNPVSFMTYLATLKGMDAPVARKKAKALLEKYGLGDVAHKKIKTFSKGMSQKVQVLATVIHDPDLVVLDEPFSGLDPVNQAILEELIQDLKTRGKTVIFSTHVMQHAERLCDRLHIIAKGETRFIGNVREAHAILPTRLEIITSQDAPDAALNGWKVEHRHLSDGKHQFAVQLNGTRVDEILRTCLDAGMVLDDVSVHRPSLHEIFIHLVRDGGEVQ